MKKQKIFKDNVHGFIAKCTSKECAWRLIRNECYKKGLYVPTLEQIKEQK